MQKYDKFSLYTVSLYCICENTLCDNEYSLYCLEVHIVKWLHTDVVYIII